MISLIISKFDEFIHYINIAIKKYLQKGDRELTRFLWSIQTELWKNYKIINGTSAGFLGIAEYIVFSAVKNFIELLNKEKRDVSMFVPKEINNDLYYFELANEKNSLKIYRSARLTHIPIKININRAPDIVILKEINKQAKII